MLFSEDTENKCCFGNTVTYQCCLLNSPANLLVVLYMDVQRK